MRNIALFSVMMMLVLSGCVSQDYAQKVGEDGNSVMTVTVDFSRAVSSVEMPAGAGLSATLNKVCAQNTDPKMTCSAKGSAIVLQKKMTPDDGYYAFDVSRGLPFVNYEIKMYAFPTDMFGAVFEKVYPGLQLAEPVDLRKRVQSRMILDRLKEEGVNWTYTVTMPGEIYETNSGRLVPKQGAYLDKSTVRYDMADVLYQSEPVVVKSREIDAYSIGITVLVLVMAYLAWDFFMRRRGKA
ncbi:MAG: hypothetical protein ACP5NX_02740 [Candidatus Bilamarchaeaceae archaeon]